MRKKQKNESEKEEIVIVIAIFRHREHKTHERMPEKRRYEREVRSCPFLSVHEVDGEQVSAEEQHIEKRLRISIRERTQEQELSAPLKIRPTGIATILKCINSG